MLRILNKISTLLYKKILVDEASAGILMILCAACAMFLANSPYSEEYQSLLKFQIAGISIKGLVKDMLMPIFFLVIGMELKKEIKAGSLTPPNQLKLTILAALAGMLAPALIFILISYNNQSVWQGAFIPSATDIAFALCIFTFSKKSLPQQARIFLLALATFDDIGAIAIIMIITVNHASLSIPLIMMTSIGLASLLLLNYRHIYKLYLYLIIGLYLATCLYMSNISTSIAGIAVGLAIPLNSTKNYSPISHGVKLFSPIVNFLILPIFAFTSSGVTLHNLSVQDIISPIPLGIACGLFFGKQLGVFGITRCMVYFGLAPRPQGISWWQFYGISILTGIGFTMSLFMGSLIFPNESSQNMVKIGVIIGSTLSAILGTTVLHFSRKTS